MFECETIDTTSTRNMESMKKINEFRQSRELCDVTLLVDGKEYVVHRNILASCSPFFRALFTNGMTDTTNTLVKLPEVDFDIFEILLNYAYTHEANITTENVGKLLPLADRFDVGGLFQMCCRFLRDNIAVDNAIDIWRFARFYFCFELEKFAFRFILKHFENIASESFLLGGSNVFVTLTIEELIELIENDSLNVKREEEIFRAIVTWVHHDEKERKKYVSRILLNIRLGLISAFYFRHRVKCHPYVRNNEECMPLISQARNYFYNYEYKSGPSRVLSRSRRADKVLFAIGGWSKDGLCNAIECYDWRANSWTMVHAENFGAKAYAAVAVIDQKIYLIGGIVAPDEIPINTVLRFDLSTKTWTAVAHMRINRAYASAVVLNGYIYVMGGCDGFERLSSVERYDPRCNQWTMMHPMIKRRSDASACSIDDRVVIVGGFNGEVIHDSCEMYDPKTGEWTSLPPMDSCRSGCGCASYRNSVYVFGGFNGIQRLKTMERLSPTISQWTQYPNMTVPRSNLGVVALDDKIFAVGGYNGYSTISRVECFDLDNEYWYDAAEMNIERSALSTIVAEEMPNLSEYKGSENLSRLVSRV